MATNLINEKLTKAKIDEKALSDIRRIVNQVVKNELNKADAYNAIEAVLMCHDVMTGEGD